MKRGSKILIGIIFFLVVLSVSATYYKTVTLQDFEVTGAYVEFPTEDSSYVWFVYDNEEYELELKTASYEAIVSAIANELNLPETELDAAFLGYLQTAYDEGELTTTETEETEETTEEEALEESTDSESTPEEDIDEGTDATSTEPIIEEAVINMQL